MGILQTLKSKLASRKAAKGAKSKPSFRAWCKAGGHEVGQDNVGELMKRFVSEVKPSKASVRDAVGHVFAASVKAIVPPSLDSAALDAVTAASAKSGSLEAVALRASLSMEPEVPANLEADLDKVSALLDSGKHAEGLKLLQSVLKSLPTNLPAAKDAPKSPTDAASASKASGSPLSTPNAKSSGTSFPPRSKAEGVSLSASSAKASKPATASKPTAAGAVLLSDKPASSAEANRRERVKRLLADCGVPLDSTEGVTWCELGEKNLRSLALLFKRKLDATRTWRERAPLENEVLSVLAGNGQPVDVFRKFKFIADDDANSRTIMR